MNPSDIQAESFLKKMEELPVQPSWIPSIAMIEKNLRQGTWSYSAEKAVLTDSLGMRVAIQPDGHFTPVS
jgi:hypothetical protein